MQEKFPLFCLKAGYKFLFTGDRLLSGQWNLQTKLCPLVSFHIFIYLSSLSLLPLGVLSFLCPVTLLSFFKKQIHCFVVVIEDGI